MMFVFVFYLAGRLGNTEYGKFEFSMSLGYLVGMFFELGGNMILTKHVARNFYSSIYYAVKIRIVSIVAVLIIFYVILFSFDLYENSRITIIYACAGIAFSSMMNLYFSFFRGARKMNYEAGVLVFQKAIFIIVALLLIYKNKTSSGVMLAFLISMIAGLLIIFAFFKRNEPHYLKSDKKQDIGFSEYFKDVFTLALVEIFSNIYYRINQVFIEHFRGYEEVSIYGVAYKVVEVFINFPSILLIALFPAFVKLAADNIKEFKRQFNKMLMILLGAGFVAGIICFVIGEPVFKIIGQDYDRSYILLRYLTLPLLFLFPNYIVTQGLIALNKNLVFAKILLYALILNIVLSLILVPEYGSAGSAIAIGVCEFGIFVSGYFYIRNYISNAQSKA